MNTRPRLEVADVIREHGDAFLDKYGGVLTAAQKKTLRALAACRTAALGGHVERCGDCGHERIAYNSCRNRHCPKCQALARARWLEREASYLLPVEYHHVVFTLPPAVAELALAHPRVMYNLLFRAASQTLLEVAANPKRLGAQIGILAVLHTWGQNLHFHPHLHCVVTGGGLSCDAKGKVKLASGVASAPRENDAQSSAPRANDSDVSAAHTTDNYKSASASGEQPRWISCRPGFFLPVRVLSRLFRGKFLALLRRAVDRKELTFAGGLSALAEPSAFQRWLTPLYKSDWVVYAKPPFGKRPACVLKYLARYTHRVAISNARLLSLSDGRVSFRYKDYAAGGKSKTMTLRAEEFLRRFAQHILPKGFVKIRHYGLLANRRRQDKLKLCRRLLLVANTAAVSADDDIAEAALPTCPACGSVRLLYLRFDRKVPVDDTS